MSFPALLFLPVLFLSLCIQGGDTQDQSSDQEKISKGPSVKEEQQLSLEVEDAEIQTQFPQVSEVLQSNSGDNGVKSQSEFIEEEHLFPAQVKCSENEVVIIDQTHSDQSVDLKQADCETVQICEEQNNEFADSTQSRCAQDGNNQGEEKIEAQIREVKNFVLDNGDVYTGQLKDGMRHGFGDCTYPNIGWYCGEFLLDEQNGKGQFYFDNGDKFEGVFRNDQMEDGSFRFCNNDLYVGKWQNGQFHGGGVYHSCVNRIVYNGQYNKGKLNGPVIINYIGRGSFTGTFQDGKRHGPGAFVFANGASFQGEFKDDMADGHGVQIYPNGDEFNGDYKDNHQHGLGVYKFKCGDTFKVVHMFGLWNGPGLYTYANGHESPGIFKNACRNGSGGYEYSNEVKIKQEFNTDKMTFKKLQDKYQYLFENRWQHLTISLI